MSFTGFPTLINLNDTDPPPKPDTFNVEQQAGSASFDTASGQWIRPESGCYRVPHVGGVLVVTDDYDLGGPDTGWTFIVNSASAVTVKLPAAVPMLNPQEGLWRIRIKNVGAGTLTIDPNGLNFDGSASTFTVPQGTGFEVSTDGTDYYSWGNFGLSSPMADTFTGDGSTTAFTLSKAPAQGFAFVFWNAGGGIVLPTDYSISGTTLTTSFEDAGGNSIPAGNGDKIYVVYFT